MKYQLLSPVGDLHFEGFIPMDFDTDIPPDVVVHNGSRYLLMIEDNDPLMYREEIVLDTSL
jgi:hypothetical protein